MRQLRAEGLSLRQIAKRLQTEGFTNRNGKRLSPQLIANVLGRSGFGSLYLKELLDRRLTAADRFCRPRFSAQISRSILSV